MGVRGWGTRGLKVGGYVGQRVVNTGVEGGWVCESEGGDHGG